MLSGINIDSNRLVAKLGTPQFVQYQEQSEPIKHL